MRGKKFDWLEAVPVPEAFVTAQHCGTTHSVSLIAERRRTLKP